VDSELGPVCTVPRLLRSGISGISWRPPADVRRRNQTRPPTASPAKGITVGHISTWASHTRR